MRPLWHCRQRSLTSAETRQQRLCPNKQLGYFLISSLLLLKTMGGRTNLLYSSLFLRAVVGIEMFLN